MISYSMNIMKQNQDLGRGIVEGTFGFLIENGEKGFINYVEGNIRDGFC